MCKFMEKVNSNKWTVSPFFCYVKRLLCFLKLINKISKIKCLPLHFTIKSLVQFQMASPCPPSPFSSPPKQPNVPKKVFSTHGARMTRHPQRKQTNKQKALDPFLTSYTTIHWQRIIAINVEAKALKLVELYVLKRKLEIDKGFLEKPKKSIIIKEKNR